MSLLSSFLTEQSIQSGDLSLRAPKVRDFKLWSELRQESQSFLKPWEPSWSPNEFSLPHFKSRVRHYHMLAREDRGYAYLIFNKDESVLYGGLTLSKVHRGVAQSCAIGYWIGEPYARHGIMSKAVTELLPHVFDNYGFNRLEAACLAHNHASIALLNKLGFVHEGKARQYLKINGEWQDHMLFALLACDYSAGRKNK